MHVTAVFTNGASSDNALYIDGVKQTLSVTQNSPPSTNWMSPDLTVSGYFYNYHVHHLYDSYVDEVKVYRGAMTQAQVTADYNAAHSCGTQLLAEYRFDEVSWNGTANEVIDSSGSGYHGQAIGSSTPPTTAFSNPAKSPSPGTCAYGDFTGGAQAVQLPTSFPRLSNSLSITAWFKANALPGNDYPRIFVDDNGSNGYGLRVTGAKIGYFKKGAITKAINTANVLQTGQWYFAAAVQNDEDDTAKVYLYNQAGTLITQVSSNEFTDAVTNTIPTGTAPSIGAHANFARPFNGNIDEVRVYSGALTQTEIEAIRDETRACPSYVTNTPAGSFNCVATGASADTGHLYMQMVGTPFNIDVAALKSDRSVETTFAAASDQNVLVELVDGAGTTACTARAALSPTVSQTVTLTATNAGRKNIPVTVNKAYRNLRCRVTDANQSPTVVGCSSDNFAVRPVEFVISSNANADTGGNSASSVPVFKAEGDAFTLTVDSVAGYDGTPLIDQTRYNVRNNMVTTGTLTGNFSVANSVNGRATGTNFKYSEVGYFKFMRAGIYDDTFTDVDRANGDCVGTLNPSGGLYPCNIINESSTDYFGRFIPHHFEISNVSSSAACSAFNYYGQNGVTTNFTIKAQNSANSTTQNYTGAFAKLPLNTWSSSGGLNFAATGLPSGASLTSGIPAPTGSWANGEADIIATHKVDRLATPMNPANVSITSRPSDSDSVTMSSATLASNIPFRYGRLSLRNAYGSELLPLTIPVEAQYWDGSTYRTNALDTCTNITTGDAELGNFKKNLNAGETTLLPSGGSMNQGKYNFTLSAPGAGNSGSVDLTLKLDAFPWMGTSNPSARATFGLNKSPIIYMRGNF